MLPRFRSAYCAGLQFLLQLRSLPTTGAAAMMILSGDKAWPLLFAWPSPSLQPHYRPSSLLRLLLSPAPLSWNRPPQVRCRISSLAPPGSTRCVLMTFGLRCLQPACRPHPASLPVRVPAVESLLRASFRFTSRLRLAFRYGCRHRLRSAPFIQLDSAHAGHTGADPLVRGRPPGRPSRARPSIVTGFTC